MSCQWRAEAALVQGKTKEMKDGKTCRHREVPRQREPMRWYSDGKGDKVVLCILQFLFTETVSSQLNQRRRAACAEGSEKIGGMGAFSGFPLIHLLLFLISSTRKASRRHFSAGQK